MYIVANATATSTDVVTDTTDASADAITNAPKTLSLVLMLTARGKDAAKLLARCAALALVMREQGLYDLAGHIVPDRAPECILERQRPKSKKNKHKKKKKEKQTTAECNTHNWDGEYGDVCRVDEDGDVCTPMELGPAPPASVQATWAERHRRWVEGYVDDEHEPSRPGSSSGIHEPSRPGSSSGIADSSIRRLVDDP